MPTSASEGKDIALSWYEKIRPCTVIDVGAGEGTYAKLMRASHPGHWTAVEVWPPYVDEFALTDLYDEVLVGDVRTMTAFDVDLVIAGDVLEHMTKVQARQVLQRARAARNLIVSVPVMHLDQGPVNGNPFEIHVEHWTAADMDAELRSSGRVVESWVGHILAYFWWEAADGEPGDTG